jgi:hypothetical protein
LQGCEIPLLHNGKTYRMEVIDVAPEPACSLIDTGVLHLELSFPIPFLFLTLLCCRR